MKIFSTKFFKIGIIVLIILASASIRFYKFNSLYSPNHDESIDSLTAFDIYQGIKFPIWHMVSSHPGLAIYEYLAAFSYKIFGPSDFSYRLPGIILSLATIYGGYLLIRELLGRKAALLSSFFFAFCAWNVAISRELATVLGLELFFAVFSSYFFYKGINRKSLKSLAIAAVLLALGLCTYDSILALLPVFFLFYLIASIITPFVKRHPTEALLNLGKAIIFLLIFVIITGSLVYLGFRKDFKAPGALYPAWLFQGNDQFTQYSFQMFGPQFKPLFEISVQLEIKLLKQLFPQSVYLAALAGVFIVFIRLIVKRRKSDLYIFLTILILFLMFTTFKGASGGLNSRYMYVLVPWPYILTAITVLTVGQILAKILSKLIPELKTQKVEYALILLFTLIIAITQLSFLYNNYLEGWIKKQGGNTLFTEDTWHSHYFREIGQFIKKDAIDNKEYKKGSAVVLYDPGKIYPLEFQIPWYTKRQAGATWGLSSVMVKDDAYLKQRLTDLISQDIDINTIYFIDGVFDLASYDSQRKKLNSYDFYQDTNRFSYHHPTFKTYKEIYEKGYSFPIVQIYKFIVPMRMKNQPISDSFDSPESFKQETELKLGENNTYELILPEWLISGQDATVQPKGTLTIEGQTVESVLIQFQTFESRLRIKNLSTSGKGQSFGFGVCLWSNDALFFVYNGQLVSRTYNKEKYFDTPITGINLENYHIYKIVLGNSKAQFFIDGELRSVHNKDQYLPSLDHLPLIFNAERVLNEKDASAIEIDWAKAE